MKYGYEAEPVKITRGEKMAKLRKGTRVDIFGNKDSSGRYKHGGYKQGPGGLNQILIPDGDQRVRMPAMRKNPKIKKITRRK